ncbi:MAG: PadR family transcriptional regulator [Oscillospiraceae bacterium]|nr:PadR family transcriptional regulator [Oscillospiraceae bacterium]
MLRHGILGLLNYGDMTGYQIMEVFRDSLHYFWTAQTSQIYRELQTLETSGFVSHTAVKGCGRPDSKRYAITEEGRAELIRWLTQETGFDTRSRLLMLTFFRGELPREENIRFFEAIKESASRFGAGLGRPADRTAFYEQALHSPERALYWKMTVEYGRRYVQMLCDWCDTCIAMLREEDV